MIEWLISSSVLIIVMTAIRYFFRGRLSMRARYALWLPVALRLLIPVSFLESSVSVLNFPALENMLVRQEAESAGEWNPGERDVESAGEGNQQNRDAAGAGAEQFVPALQEGVSGNGMPEGNPDGGTEAEGFDQDGRRGEDDSSGPSGRDGSTAAVLAWLTAKGMHNISPWQWGWILGTFVCAGIVAATNANYRKKMYRSRKIYQTGRPGRLPVYVSPLVATPCLFGVLHPAIYITSRAAGKREALKYILCHENTHYKHKDNIWALVRIIVICIHWYNPLVWLAAYLSRQDCELACDEETIRLLGERERIPYGRALLDFSVQTDMVLGELQLSTTMSGGKKQLKERLLVIVIQQPRRYISALAAVSVLVLFVSAATFTGRVEGKEAEGFGTGETFMAEEDESLNGMADSGKTEGMGKADPAPEDEAGKYYVEIIPLELKEGEDYTLKIGGVTVPESGDYRTRWLELARTRGGREETVQTFAADEIKVLYTRTQQQIRNEGGNMWNNASEREALYAKPLYRTEDLPFSESTDFTGESGDKMRCDAPDGGILLADLNFDGYQDICLQAGTDSANIPYYCFLWNPEEEGFEPAYMIPNVQVDREAQWIVSATREEENCSSVKYYRFDENNVLHMVRYTEKNESPDAVFPGLDLTYCETSYGLPAVDEWDYGTVYGGALTERMITYAKQALTELYEWTGTKLDTVCFSVTIYGDFAFGQTPADVRASRTFYNRCYGEEAGFEFVIRHMSLSTEREVWYSPVTQWRVPDNKDEMTDQQLVEWYFGRSALTKGEEIASVWKAYDEDYVVQAESGLYYELTLRNSTREVSQVYGPYDSFPVH